jgi:hypothetical protein
MRFPEASMESAMTSPMPPIPPANRSKEPGNNLEPKDTLPKQQEKHDTAAEKGDTANIKQNTTNKGLFQGRRMK